MILSKETILSKTHYGINIYAYVLRQYYLGSVVLSLSGRDCKPAANPFNNHKNTLQISIVNNCAQHRDNEVEECKGNAFDFAGKYFGLAGDELYEKLNDVMHLRIGAPNPYYCLQNAKTQKKEVMPKQIESPVISYFKAPVTNTYPSNHYTLLEVFKLIKGNGFVSQTTALRAIADKKVAKEYKAANFDYVTFSGTFIKRTDKALQKHSGLLTIDLDHLSNTDEWKSRLLVDEYFETELLFTSPSGDGLKWVIHIDLNKTSHLHYFNAINQYLLKAYGKGLDTSGKDISRACLLPHDPNAYINPKYL